MTFIHQVSYLFIFIDVPKHRNGTVSEGDCGNDSLPSVNEIGLIDE